MKTLTVFLPAKNVVYMEGYEQVKLIIEVKNKDANFQYWQIIFNDGAKAIITAPCIFHETAKA